MKQLHGTGVALVTPFREDNSVDTDALARIVHYNIDGGMDYLVILGTTGESVTLSQQEKELVIHTVVAANGGKLPLVLGVGGNNTALVVSELQQLDLDDFDAILSVSPSYNKPTQEGIYQHFKAISAASSKPIILYNVPGRTGSNMLPQTVVRLATDCKNIIAIKEASGDMLQVAELIGQKPEDFMVISGDDFTALPTVLAGGVGVISVLGQGLPKEFSSMIRLGINGNPSEAYALHYTLLKGMELIFKEGNPAGIKAVFETLRLSNALVRLPLVEASKDLKEQIVAFMHAFYPVHA
ncbi:4-hydroxy-tetrahydrodipicolinate synthase [Spongiimicrobium sp. 3-5]|uniref:4-hydroxy-tetrahydrodipicolinate synthase n=1 Tax=Spongiimicrobium sp. 3-5 TaxID=3332596 RepID=UPI00397E93B5